jgi:hypothetical protein
MLHLINNLSDPFIDLLRDDPVRPEIPTAARVHDSAEIFVWIIDGRPAAVTCVRYCAAVPRSVQELDQSAAESVAVFYTIWSYQSGAGRQLIRAAADHIQNNRKGITRWVTLSPKTEMARKFHHSNGALTLQENDTTVNYEYLLDIVNVVQQLT